MADIVCLSPQYWRDSWFRKHHFMARFAAQGHQVFYVEPSHSVVRRAGTGGVDSNPWLRREVRTEADGLTVISPARLFPKPLVPAVSRFNHARMIRSAARVLRARGVSRPIVWVYDVEYAWAIDRLEPSRVVFDLVDDLVGYERSETRRSYVGDAISRLAERAYAGVYTAPALAERYPVAKDGRQLVVPNGFDDRLFSPDTEPDPAYSFPGPVIGFVGTLFQFLDYRLLLRVADAFPEASLVFVGRIEQRVPKLVELLARPNVTHVGYVEKERVPGLVAHFDVCIAPFRQDEVARVVSPLKVFEYLAAGKPVVASDLAAMRAEPVAPWIRFADGPDAFCEQVADALDTGLTDTDELGAELAAYTWDGLFERVAPLVSG